MQLPAWNEALGLPRPWDQQWSLRMQQVLAFESDLLEYGDIFEGSVVMEAKTAELAEAATAELADVEALGGAFEAIDELKRRLVRSQAERVRRIESGDQMVVGVNCYTETAPSPLVGDGEIDNVMKVDHAVEAEQIMEVERWRTDRDGAAVHAAPRPSAAGGRGRRPRRQHHGGHDRAGTRRWHHGGVGRRAPRGLRRVPGAHRRQRRRGPARGRRGHAAGPPAQPGAGRAHRGAARLLVAKPGLDGHSNGAEQIAVAARDAGFEVIYQGIRLTPAQIVAAARDEDVDIVGLSILSGSHLDLVPDVLDRLRAAGSTAAVVVGGIIPPEDAELLIGKGVASVYTPKDYSFDRIMEDLVSLAERQRAATPG